VQTAKATMETAISAPSTPRARSRLATAAGITPVSLHQLINAISLPVHPPRRSGRRQARTVMGRATKMNTNITRSPPKKYLAERLEGQVEPERDEHEQGGNLRNLSEESFEERGMLVVVAKPEQLHVADHQPHDEGREVGRPAERLGREVRERDDSEDGHPRRLVP
jgi:hypothetical protein